MAIDNKYGRVTLERGSVDKDEPVVVFRAQDALLMYVLQHYRELCVAAGSPERHLAGIDEVQGVVNAWQAENFTQVPRSEVSHITRKWGPLSEVLPETPEPPREDGPRSDAPTLWRRLQVAARVIKAFKPEDPSPELVAFLRDIRDAVDGDLLEDELSGDLIRFARGQGRLLTALLAAQGTEVAEDATDDHSAERAAHADNWEAQP